MFSKACEYAIRAAIYISAESSKEKKTGIAEICEQIEAPKHFTAKILQILTRKRIVSSQKGVNGGFYMDKKQNSKKLIEIVVAIDGNVLFTGCGLGLKECSDDQPCPLHEKFGSIRANIKKMIADTTIESLANKLIKGKGFVRTEE